MTRRVRPRYGRLAAAAGAVVTTTVSALGGLGLIATGPSQAAPAPTSAGAELAAAVAAPAPQDVRPGLELARAWAPEDRTLPADSGEGRRVVFSQSRQQVWLVAEDGSVARTYLVSGSLYDNLDPGTFDVYSRSEQAYGVDDSGTMQLFVRFTRGDNAAIGFHDIPQDDGEPLQSVDELGTPTSHGCIRQRRADAEALWDFAPLGTAVVVTA